ncbi:lactase-phlorizin hydrolase-like [Schistocerca piceifrons]|uniref:lactase-phlorizin hydrolase-like n=1 Tax=Schistocerca piceifrons TaxID=274613 RepID=UPI001F5F66D5|nr:lactase-phlorizin hydrolase-like [Schistocerca piceifrons]
MVAPMTLCLELLAIACLLATATGREVNQFPEGFLLGAATASYQIEAAWNEDVQQTQQFSSESLKAASKSPVVGLKAKVYRFSISWPRILPNGDLDVMNQPGIDYYNNLINLLLENDVQPLVKLWTTFNEPISFTGGGQAPSQNASGIGDYLASHTVIRAHAMVYRLYDEQYRSTQNGRVGITLSTNWYEPLGDKEERLAAQERVFQLELGLYANPIFVDGDYPAVVRERVVNNSRAEGRPRSRLPSFTEEEKRMINGQYNNRRGPEFSSFLFITPAVP